MPRHIKTEEHKARKNHVCDYCGCFIEKGEIYKRDVLEYDGSLYTWKSHPTCTDIASKLKMFDGADEGVTMDFFQEFIKSEYQAIMGNEYQLLYESTNFKVPSFKEQLRFVKRHHDIFEKGEE